MLTLETDDIDQKTYKILINLGKGCEQIYTKNIATIVDSFRMAQKMDDVFIQGQQFTIEFYDNNQNKLGIIRRT